MEEEREGQTDGWTGVSDGRDKKALINHQLNKHMPSQSKAGEQDKCHIQINRKKSTFESHPLESTGDIFGNCIQSKVEDVPGDFHQQKDEKIRLSKPAPLPAEPPQAGLLRERTDAE